MPLDLVHRESLVAWLGYLRTQYTTVAFRASSAFIQSNTPSTKKAKTDDALGKQALWTYLQNVASTRSGGGELVVAVTGVVNVSVVCRGLWCGLCSCVCSPANQR